MTLSILALSMENRRSAMLLVKLLHFVNVMLSGIILNGVRLCDVMLSVTF
jgi:hypothetical protein